MNNLKDQHFETLKASTPNLKLKYFENNCDSDINNQINMSSSNEIYERSNNEGNCLREPSIQVKLEAKNLWQKFSSIGTEMIITKCGR